MNLRFLLTFLSVLFVSFCLQAQDKGTIENVSVENFESPFSTIIVNAFGTDLPVMVTRKTKLKGEKGKSLEPSQIEEGMVILKLEYILEGENYVATKIETEISADGSIKVSGLYEGEIDGLPYVDGYPIDVPSGVSIKGSKKKNCECSGLLVPSFNSPMISPGNFYVTVKGFIDDRGIVKATDVELCSNTFGQPEQELLAAINGNLNIGTNRISQVPTGIYVPPSGLYNGKVAVGKYSYPLTNDIELQGYINQVGYRLLPDHTKSAQTDGGEISYRFYVIDDAVPNAFAFPNGMIFIHTGLLDIIENEAQLACVLGHEIAHVTHEHGKERYETTQKVGFFKDLVETATDLTGVDRLINQKATQLMWTNPGLSRDLARSVGKVASEMTPEGISNIMQPQTKLESQADRVGLLYAYEAGYDIREGIKFWEKMAELTNQEDFKSTLTSQMMASLKSDRNSYRTSGQNMFQKLGSAGSEVLANQVLNTIYTSHPKAIKRSRAVSRLVSSVYAGAEWTDMKINEDKYLEKIR